MADSDAYEAAGWPIGISALRLNGTRNKLSGTWVFRGTRVPVSALFENLKDGATVAQFLKWFPGVDGRNVEAVLAHEVESLADVVDS